MIYSLDKFLEVRTELIKTSRKLVFTNGCFDIIHKGHISYLSQAKMLGNYLVIGLNSDSSVKILKGDSRPINNQDDRAFVLDNLKPVDAVIIFDEETPFNLINSIKPDFLVKGGDWKEENIIGSDIVKEYGGTIVSLKYIDNYSTTSIFEKIRTFKS
ncbi:MAG TPA: D-glycero-beta-D-manno-heptose 1-phosphate adenylyltransferase [Ignavibacteria bacterium]